MKKMLAALLLAVVCSGVLSGCGQKTAEGALTVYSFSGENEILSVSDGVIVLNGAEETFYGGELEAKSDAFSDITAFSATFYIVAADGESALLSNRVEDMTGGTIRIPGALGKISGDVFRDADLDALPNGLFFRLEVTDLEGRTNEYSLQLTLTEVTGPANG